MAILDFNSTIRTTAGGQITSTIVTANNIGSYAPSLSSTYYIGTTQNVFNRASAAQTLTGVSIDGTANNITAYTINQNVGTGNAPSFTGMTSTAMLVASTSMNSVDDWQNSPISIRERGLVAAAQSANTYSPNLNFHWASRISNSLWMDANGNLSWGSYDGTGVPSSDGAFYANNLYASIYFDKNNTVYYLDPANSGTSLLVAGSIGAGLTTPLHKIQATGLVSASDATYNNDSTFIGAILNNDGTNPGLDLRRWNGGAAGTNNHGATYIATNSVGDTIFYNGVIAANTRATNEKMRIAVNGNVGIGTTGPSYKLDIAGSAYASTYMYAGVFYDNDNTAYYANPSAASIFNGLKLVSSGNDVSGADYSLWILGDNSDWGIGIDKSSANYGITYNLAASHTYAIQGRKNGTEYFRLGTDMLSHDTRLQAPIFYDSDNTTYYLDAANTGTSLFISGRIIASGSASSVSGSTLLTGYYTNGSLTVFGTEYSSGGPFLGYAVSPSTSAAASFLSSTGIAIQRSAYIQDGGTHRWYLGASQTVIIGSAATLSESMRLTSTGLGVNSNNPDTNLQIVGHIHVGNQTTFENTGGWNKTIYLDGAVHARMRILGSAFASGKNSATETSIWVDNSVSPYSGLDTNAGSFRISAGFTTLTNSARSPIFYDSDDTNYYCDPNSVSRLSSLRVYSAFDTASSDVYANMRVMRNNATTDGMYIGYGNSGSTAALTRIFGGGATTGELSKYSTYTLEPGSFRSPIFYDSDDTNYYGDFASTSRLNILNLVSYAYINGQTLNGQSFYQWEGATYRNPADHTPQLLIRKDNTTTGINGFAPALALYNNNGADQTTVGMAFVSAEAVSPTQGNAVELAGIIAKKESSGTAGAWSQGSLNFFVKDFGTRRDVMSMSSSGAVTAFIDVRAPIFYDSGNTAFYVDPASTSNLNALTVAGGNATIYRDLIVNGGTSGNFGNRIIVQGTATTYTLQDTNLRPTIYLTGAYPVVTLNHTVTNNTNHGPTIQFAFNGLTTGGTTSRQILIGASGDGNRLDFGFSGGASGTNSDYNPHNGIAGYSGITIMRLFNNGVLLGNTGAYPNQITSTSYALDVRGTGYSDTDFRAPIFYDSNNTAYYLDASNTGTSLNTAGAVVAGTYVYSTTYLQAGNNNIYPNGYTNTLILNIGNSAGNNWIAGISIAQGGNVGIGTTSPSYKLQVVGSFAATTKSFNIEHPTKPNTRLIYGSLESPYHGIRLTGKGTLINGSCKVNLPDYIYKLVREESVSIHLTGVKCGKVLYVDEINVKENYFTVIYDKTMFENYKNYEFFWDFTAIRSDVPELITEA